jgi:hypothetical protein
VGGARRGGPAAHAQFAHGNFCRGTHVEAGCLEERDGGCVAAPYKYTPISFKLGKCCML